MKIYLTIAAILFCSMTGFSQTQTKNLNWDELKTTQSEERVSLENMQKETLTQIVELQKAQLTALKSALASSGNDMPIVATKLKEERIELAKLHSEERTKLATLHSEERKAFVQNKSLKPNQ